MFITLNAYGQGRLDFMGHVLKGPGAANVLQDSLPDNLLRPCQEREKNATNLQDINDDHVQEDCRAQIKSSTDDCLQDPGIKDLGSAVTLIQSLQGGQRIDVNNMKSNAEEVLKLYENAIEKYQALALTCEEQSKKVEELCKPALEKLKIQHKQYTRSALASAPPDFYAVDEKFRNQIEKTELALGAAAMTIESARQCDLSQARIYKFAADKTHAAIAAMSFQGTEDQPQPSSDLPVSTVQLTKKTKDSENTEKNEGQKMARVQNTLWGITENQLKQGVGSLGSADGGIQKINKIIPGPVWTLGRGDGAGTYIETAAAIGKAVYKPENLARYNVVTGAIAMYMHATPTAVCDQAFYDPVQAYHAKCPLYTANGRSSSARAQETLALP